jgi:hypothetical protein
MNGSSALNYPTNEQLIGKFHVTNVDKIPVNNHPEDIIPQTVTIPDESGCASRFQMIRVDRNFGNGRWKVHDYEPPENTPISTIPSVNTIENESINVCNDPNITTSAATAFQQQRMTLNSTPAVVPTAANVPPPPPTGFLHGYAPNALTNQSYLLSNHPPHPQFGYYHFYPPPYSHYAPPWATPAALAAANPYLQPPTTSLLSSTANHNDPLRLSDTGIFEILLLLFVKKCDVYFFISDNNGENTYPNPTIDPLQNAQFAAYLYALQHSHSQYIPQTSSTAPSYATIPSYHPLPPPHPTILPLQNLPNSTTDIQQSHQSSILTSPKHEGPKSLLQQSSLITPKTKPSVTTVSNGISNDPTKSIDVHDLISSSPALTTAPPTLISPINISTTNVPTTSLNNIWSYTTAGSPLNLIQTTQTAAVTEMNLLNNEPSQNTEIAHDILKELTTPTKQNK